MTRTIATLAGRRSRLSCPALLASLLLVVSTACVSDPPGVDRDAGTDTLAEVPAAADHSHDLVVDWSAPATIAGLTASADTVVIGRVITQRPDVLRSHDPVDPRVHADIPITISTVTIEQVITSRGEPSRASAASSGAASPGSAAAVGRTIEVQELGGIADDGCRVEPADKPLLRRGSRNVLFLRASTAAHGLATVAAPRFGEVGNRGRFEVIGADAVAVGGDPLTVGEPEVRSLASLVDEVATAAISSAPVDAGRCGEVADQAPL